jgi:hypothetical protein
LGFWEVIGFGLQVNSLKLTLIRVGDGALAYAYMMEGCEAEGSKSVRAHSLGASLDSRVSGFRVLGLRARVWGFHGGMYSIMCLMLQDIMWVILRLLKGPRGELSSMGF